MAAAEAAAFRDVDEVCWDRAPPNSALRAAAVLLEMCVCGIGPPTGTDTDICSDVRLRDETVTGEDWYAKATPRRHAAEAAGNRVVFIVNVGLLYAGGWNDDTGKLAGNCHQ